MPVVILLVVRPSWGYLFPCSPEKNGLSHCSKKKKCVFLCSLFAIIVFVPCYPHNFALPLVPGWILVPSDPWSWQEKLLYFVVTALPSKLCAALHGQSNVGSMCDCKPWSSLDLSVLVGILYGVDSDHGTGPRRNGSVNSMSTLCPIERSCWPMVLL